MRRARLRWEHRFVAGTRSTVLGALVESLSGAGRFNPNDAVAPCAILWADHDAQWRPLMPRLRELLPNLLTFGDYVSAARTGPAIWLRSVVDRALDAGLPGDATPILYLPGVTRQELRAVAECRDELRPLAELQYRGTCWSQKNGKDWTVEAFLVSSDGGLTLDLARDAATRSAMLGALAELAETPINRLRGKRLEREDFDRLLSDDLPRDVLRWLNDSTPKPDWGLGRWAAFRSRCREELGVDPDKDGELVAAERLGTQLAPWDMIWSRYVESPELYPGIVGLLRKAKPKPADLLVEQSPSWPQNNESQEDELRKGLAGLGAMAPTAAAFEVRELEKVHGARREWVWSKLGLAPLAHALSHLSRLAEAASTNLGGASLEDMADQYVASACEIDDEALAAAAAVKTTADFDAVSKALDTVYRPWLEQAAQHHQALAEREPMPCADAMDPADLAVDAGGVILFADGLRFDVSRRLVSRMQDRSMVPKLSWRWAGLPTVTATGKPAVSPVARAIVGRSPGEGFSPVLNDGGQMLTTDRFRKLLESGGYEVLPPGETGDSTGRGWTEDGSLDKLGHDLKGRLAAQIDDQVELLLERVETLLTAGWREVRLVTDHGWLWLPGGLPKVDLPHYLTESRWARCAAIKGASKVEVPTSPWYWNDEERIALAPGIGCFKAGHEYAHGGLSPQESIIPVISVTPSAKVGPAVAVTAVSWMGMRCRAYIEGDSSGLQVQLRTKVNDPGSALTAARGVGTSGDVSLLVEDEDQEGASAVIVVLGSDGRSVSQIATIVGGE